MTAADDRDARYVLAVDLGTGGPKVGLVSLTGRLAWQDHTAVETRLLDGGGAVQDPDDWWRAVVASTRAALAHGVVDPAAVVAVSITGQYASTVPVDGAGLPVGPCLLWMDTRGRAEARSRFGGPVSGYDPRVLATWVRRTGGVPSTSGADPIGHRLFLAAHQPEVLARARWLMEPVDQLTMRFTGVAAASPASMVVAWLVDTRTPGTTTYDPDLVARAGIDARQLPPLVPTGSVVGNVLPEVAAELGLPDGSTVRVVAATPDLHTAALGSGAVRDHQVHVAISTSSWVSCPVPAKKTDPIRQVTSVPGLTPDGYLVLDHHEVGGLALQWFRDTVLGGPGQASFDDATALAATAPAGSGGVLFTPWLNGERSPVDDHHARGGFHNVSLTTTRADLARAVLEGVAYNTRWLYEAVEKYVKRRLDPVRLLGGGASSDLWCQVHADVLDRVVERPSEPLHTNLRGAALFAAIALGEVRLDEVPGLVEVERTFRPDPADRTTYERLYAEFPGLYTRQKKMFARLNRG